MRPHWRIPPPRRCTACCTGGGETAQATQRSVSFSPLVLPELCPSPCENRPLFQLGEGETCACALFLQGSSSAETTRARGVPKIWLSSVLTKSKIRRLQDSIYSDFRTPILRILRFAYITKYCTVRSSTTIRYSQSSSLASCTNALLLIVEPRNGIDHRLLLPTVASAGRI